MALFSSNLVEAYFQNSAGKRELLEAVNELCQFARSSTEPFGGLTVWLVGDEHQKLFTLVGKKVAADYVDASIVACSFWSQVQKRHLQKNWRMVEDSFLSRWTAAVAVGKSISHGRQSIISFTKGGRIVVPKEISQLRARTDFECEERLINFVWKEWVDYWVEKKSVVQKENNFVLWTEAASSSKQRKKIYKLDEEYFDLLQKLGNRAIVTHRNAVCDGINDMLNDAIPTQSQVFEANTWFDVEGCIVDEHTRKYLNKPVSGSLASRMEIKIGSLVMMLINFDSVQMKTSKYVGIDINVFLIFAHMYCSGFDRCG